MAGLVPAIHVVTRLIGSELSGLSKLTTTS